ncbi:hypothetical protein BDV36DRAFT_248860 [Aspergillus pseudocaelatus]|uniref:Uncharacterized protein n=1 Tax=Aspergillus pseudocaelatus TaxID=1825620 RepID=A0ABQ6WWF8_9EURO|nr:hypothetical protein BDV36DRAFT_248860 [Aspergillus pseudocaelatus]
MMLGSISSRSRMSSRLQFFTAASITEIPPTALSSFTLAPSCSSIFTIVRWFCSAADCNAVRPPSQYGRALIFAP